jgi:predicted Zn-dependent protease
MLPGPAPKLNANGISVAQRPYMRATFQAVSCALVVFFAACATNPVTGKKELSLMSEAEEIAYGQQADAEVRREMGIYDDPDLQRYVAGIGDRLAQLSHRPHLPWNFAVVDHPAVNAFALPGGYIYITRGLLPYLNDEAELAGVLGHEIAHVTARHAAQQSTRAGLGGLGLAVLGIFVPATQPFGDLTSAALGVAFLKYGRDDERESDRLGMEYAARAGWDPSGVPHFLATLARIDELSERGVPNWLATHPEPAARVVEAQPIVAKLAAADAQERGQGRFLERIDGLVVGDNPEDGIVRGNRFLHPPLRFELAFPEGWDIVNTPEQVAAQEPGQKHYMLLQHVDRPQGRSMEEVATRSMMAARFQRVSGQMISLNGAEAHVGVYQGQLEGLGAVTMRAAHIQNGRQVFLLGGFAPRASFPSVDRAIDFAIRSYRPLTQREADEVRPNRLDFHIVREGETWQSIASRGGGLIRANDLAIMNNHPVNEQPKIGARIKVVVAG